MASSEDHRLALDNCPDIAQQAGLILSAFAIIELAPPLILARLLQIPERHCETLLGHFRSFSHRLDVTRAVALDVGADAAIVLLDRIRDANAIRNKYAHGLWSQVDLGTGALMKVSAWLPDATKKSAAHWVTITSAKADCATVRAILHDAITFAHIVVPEVQPKGPPPSSGVPFEVRAEGRQNKRPRSPPQS